MCVPYLADSKTVLHGDFKEGVSFVGEHVLFLCSESFCLLLAHRGLALSHTEYPLCSIVPSVCVFVGEELRVCVFCVFVVCCCVTVGLPISKLWPLDLIGPQLSRLKWPQYLYIHLLYTHIGLHSGVEVYFTYLVHSVYANKKLAALIRCTYWNLSSLDTLGTA